MRYDNNVFFHLLLYTATFFALVGVSRGNSPDTNGQEFMFTVLAATPTSSVTLEIIPQVQETIQITISSPNVSPPFYTAFHIEARKSHLVYLPTQVFLQNEGLHEKGILLSASADVSVVLRYGNQSDTCLILPTDVLGQHYTLLMDMSSPQAESVVVIGAAVSYTTINITGAESLLTGHSVGNYLASGQVLQIDVSKHQSVVLRTTEDMSGLTIRSDQPVVVWHGRILPGASVNNIVSEMVTPVNTWGRKFVLVPPNNETNFTSRILVRSNSTLNVLSADGVTTYNLVEFVPLSLSFYQQTFVYFQSNASALVVQSVMSWESSGTVNSQMFYVPPVEQYLNRYAFSVNDSCQTVCLRAINPFQDIKGFLLDGVEVSNFVNQLTFFVDQASYTILSKASISSGFHDLNHVAPTHSFCAYASYDTDYGFHPLGMRLASLYDSCTRMLVSDGGLGDGFDNDCDGFVDEELLNGIDDDGDGLVDEDTTSAFNSQMAQTADGDLELSIDNNLIAIIVSLTVAIFATMLLIGSCLLHDFLKRRRGLRNTRITPFVS